MYVSHGDNSLSNILLPLHVTWQSAGNDILVLTSSGNPQPSHAERQLTLHRITNVESGAIRWHPDKLLRFPYISDSSPCNKDSRQAGGFQGSSCHEIPEVGDVDGQGLHDVVGLFREPGVCPRVDGPWRSAHLPKPG